MQADSLLTEPAGKPKNTGVGSLPLLQEVCLTQESKQGLLHCRQILYQLAELPGKPNIATESFKSCCKAINSNFPSLYAGQEATVRTGHGTTDWFQIGKGVHQGCILSPRLFNFYAEYIMRNAGLEEAQAGIKISRRNINNLRDADDTTLMAESEEELKSLLMKVKVERKKLA